MLHLQLKNCYTQNSKYRDKPNRCLARVLADPVDDPTITEVMISSDGTLAHSLSDKLGVLTITTRVYIRASLLQRMI